MTLASSPLTTRCWKAITLGIIAAFTSCLCAEPKSSEAAAPASKYVNPVMAGDWSDPGFIRIGDDYYTCRSSFGWQPGIPIAHSKDLVNWRYIGHAFTSHPKLPAGDTRLGIWGVEMGYNPNNKKYLIYAPTRDHSVYIFSADRPEGPYEMTFLGQQLGIDPGFFADDDGRLFFVLSRGVIYELAADGLSIKREVAKIDRSRYAFFEGPDFFKRNGWYYLVFSDGGTLPREPSTISTLRARQLEGPWEEDPNNPVMFSTNSGARFEGPAHGTLFETPSGEWFIAYHAHEPAFYSLGRQMLIQRIEWTSDDWWRPTTGKIPTETFVGPDLAGSNFALAQSDEFDSPQLGLQWFFTCKPDLSGTSWSLSEKPGVLRLRTQPGDLSMLSALPAVFQQRVIHKAFSFETSLTFQSREAGEAAGLHMFHDPDMNFWLVSTVRDGRPTIAVGKTNQGERTDLWSTENPFGDTVWLKIVVDGAERATFYFGADGKQWTKVGESIYFGASGHHLRNGERGDPDIGWVGRYKDPTAPKVSHKSATRQPGDRPGNIWTAATFGVFAVRGGAAEPRNADFEFVRVSPSAAP